MGYLRTPFQAILIILISVFYSLSIESSFANKELKGFEIGSAEAPITIIEYRSLTCSHCANFSKNVFPDLEKNYISTGKVKFEFRPFVLNAVDLNAFKLLNSVSEKDFVALDKMLFKDQDKWLVTSDSDRILENSTNALKKYALLFGLSEEKFDSVLKDKDLEEWILSMRVEGSKQFNIQSTPSFVINGKVFSGNMPFSEFEKILN